MEEKSREFNSNSTKSLAITMNFLRETLSPLSSDPLFSTIITLYTLILLYFPTLFLRIIFSPVLISTGILFLTVLRLGAIQRTEKEKDKEKGYDFLQPPPQPTDDSLNEDHKWVSCKTNTEPEIENGLCLDFDPCHFYVDSFIEWNVRAPLEVIYEEYEGEEGENDESSCEKRETQLMGIEKYASLSLYYPETDSDSSTEVDFPVDGDWDSPANMCFSWAEEDREGLIEIALDGKKETEAFFHAEEENLIEIDISPATSNEFSGEKR